MYPRLNNTQSLGAVTVICFAATAFGQITGGVASSSNALVLKESPQVRQAQFESALSTALSPKNLIAMEEFSEKLARQVSSTTTFLTDFDDVSAPCYFAMTGPLQGQHQNAYFSGVNGNGGAILNQCGNFGVDAFSQPNFLAFNRDGPYPSGARPVLPEFMVFGPNTSTVSFWVSGGSTPGYSIAAIALAQRAVLGMVTTTLTSAWTQVTLSAPGIQSVVLVGNPLYLVVDSVETQ